MNIVTERRVDNLGRVTIPKRIRNELGIKEGDTLKVSSDGTKIQMCNLSTKYLDNHIDQIKEAAKDSYCITTGEFNKLVEIMEKLRCEN